MTERHRQLLGMILAVLTPGLGRAILGGPWVGVVLFLTFVLLWQIHVGPTWLNLVIKFAIWSFFASVDVTYVRRDISRPAE